MPGKSATLVLASASPRRQELLMQIGLRFRVEAADIDESPRANELPRDYVQRMAREKALAIAPGDLPVLAADTSVTLGDEILGKPAGPAEAMEMLDKLSAREHEVLTAVALRQGDRLDQIMSVTRVRFRPLLAAEIRAYCATGEPLDKAGAYAIQGRAALFVEAISGSYSGVVGLPLYETGILLENAGICPLTGDN